MNNMLQEPNLARSDFLIIVSYVIPFIAFYFGIYTRYALRTLPIFRKDVLTLHQLIVVGVPCSLTTVAPLLPTFGDATVGVYLLTIAPVIQAGILVPEALMKLISP